jgi:hypothetical protein
MPLVFFSKITEMILQWVYERWDYQSGLDHGIVLSNGKGKWPHFSMLLYNWLDPY